MSLLTREQERIRWRSRRGLLEMDIILNRFLEQHLTHLTEGEIKIFDALLQLPDNDLLDLAMARKAIDELAAENIVIRRQGKGTFVASHSGERSSTRFLRISRDDGLAEYPQSELLSVTRERAPENTAALLELRNGASIFCIKRLLSFEGKARILDEIHVPAASFKGLDEHVIRAYTGSLYSFFESHFGIAMIRAEEHIKAVLAGPGEAAHLKIAEGVPLLRIDRVAFTYGDRPVEWRRGLCHTDQFSYVTEMS